MLPVFNVYESYKSYETYGDIKEKCSIPKCSCMNTNGDTNVCTGFVIRNECQEILLVLDKRSRKWGPPKGHRKENESSFEGAIRELYEETNIVLTTDKKYKNIKAGKVRLFITDLKKDDVNIHQNNDEIKELRWFNISDLISGKYDDWPLNSPTRILINSKKDFILN